MKLTEEELDSVTGGVDLPIATFVCASCGVDCNSANGYYVDNTIWHCNACRLEAAPRVSSSGNFVIG